MIEFDKITLAYNGKPIFRNFSLKIHKGEKIAIMGKSGIGKSSLFHLLLGFTVCQEGQILFNGAPMTDDNVWDIRKKIAFVDQDVSLGQGKAQDFIQSVFEFKTNVMKGFKQPELDSLLDYFELGRQELEKNIEDLSGGERQRVAIITAVLLGRKIFLFDEVTSALDAKLKDKTVEFFTANPDWTVIVISHDAVWTDHKKVRVFSLEDQSWKQ